MEEKNVKLISNKKLLLSASILVCSIVIIGLSLTYAYFEVSYSGTESVTGNKAATLNVTSNLESAGAISGSEMSLINENEVDNKAKKVTFTVKNETTSNVKAKYIVKLIDYSITKNLSSTYFKWKLIIKPNGGTSGQQTFTGNFLQSGIAEGTKDTTNVTGLSKILAGDSQVIDLNVGETDTLEFYVWLQNDSSKDQIYLTNGKFSGRLSIEASPTK